MKKLIKKQQEFPFKRGDIIKAKCSMCVEQPNLRIERDSICVVLDMWGTYYVPSLKLLWNESILTISGYSYSFLKYAFEKIA